MLRRIVSRRYLKVSSSLLQSTALSSFAASSATGEVLDGHVVHNEEYKANKAHMDKLLERHNALIEHIVLGGGEKAQDRLKKRNKMFVRKRIDHLVDSGSPFLEIGVFAGHEMYPNIDIPAGGLITGIGTISGVDCMIVANDCTVKAGTYFPITGKKHLRAQEIAMQNNIPCVYLVDSGGGYLPLQSEGFADRDHFGRVFYNQAVMSSKNIPQVAVVMGSCTAGGAYIPAMCDESVIVKGNGTVFLGGPPLVKAAIGEVVSAEELGGADVRCKISGVCDHYAHDDVHALDITRHIISNLNRPKNSLKELMSQQEFVAPLFDANEMGGIMNVDSKKPIDMRKIIARIVDGSKLHEFKKEYGRTIITGFCRLYGMEIGLIANDGILFSDSSLKAAHFIQLCNQRGIPLLFIQNITGFMVGQAAENGGIAKNGAKLVTAVACAKVPKVTLVVGGSFGAGNYGMCGRAYSPNFMFTWPNSRTAVMGGEQAASVLATVQRDNLEAAGKEWSPEEEASFKQPILDKYDKESESYYASSRLWDDGVISPSDTRKVLGLAFASTHKSSHESTKNDASYGVFRM